MPDFKNYYIIPAPPEEVYMALTYAPSLSLWAGENIEMRTEPETPFSIFDGGITGKNILFEPNHKIVQHWDFGDSDSPSEVTIKLHPHKKGCSVEVRHTNIPEEAWDDITTGWDDTYMASLLDFFE
ncbi:MAG: ATPase [Bacteroidetes bacterium]|jgi:activator of HSP90 ATPase|nr:ATPase [Bacteroidota bacterium]